MDFTQLNLHEDILKAINDEGYTTPTPIQEKAIPVILDGKDVLAAAQTGTGKTAGFTLPLLEILNTNKIKKSKKQVRTLIMTPTRELALQVHESVECYGRYLQISSCVVFGGVGIHPQIAKLKNGVDIVVATPGRLLDLVSQNAIDLKKIEILVLDEADRMLDMGFIHDIKKILAIVPKIRQNLLFSATFSNDIKKLADKLLNSPILIEVAKQNQANTMVKQVIYPVDKRKKMDLLVHLITTNKWKQVLVFTRTKHGANKLAKHLNSKFITSSAIHGNKSQSARVKALSEFKNGDVTVLVATDIAARGIDIESLPNVVNFELPNITEDYVHRIGRTGRAGSSGVASSLVCVDEHQYLRDIEKLIKTKIEQIVVDGFKPDPKIKPEPIQNRSNQRRNNNNSRNRNQGRSKRENS